MRMAAFEHLRRMSEVHDHLTANELRPGLPRCGLIRGDALAVENNIFKPQQTRFLLSIKTVFPKPGGRVWYDDQRVVHQQIFQGVLILA
jgi:putative restriction endonuclease